MHKCSLGVFEVEGRPYVYNACAAASLMEPGYCRVAERFNLSAMGSRLP